MTDNAAHSKVGLKTVTTVLLAVGIGLVLSACSDQDVPMTQKPNAPVTQQPTDQVNPLLVESHLPFHAPEFDRIKDSDFLPALEEGIRRHLAEVHQIANQSEPPTFVNTIEALERAGSLLRRVQHIFFGLVQADTNDTRRQIQETIMPKLADHDNEIYLDSRLFSRIELLYNQRSSLQLDPISLRLVEIYYDRFIHAGAKLSETDKATLRRLTIEESTLATQFHSRLVAATAAAAVVVQDRARLAGMSQQDMDVAGGLAASKQLNGKFVIGLQNTTQQPILSTLKDRDLRIEILQASSHRTEHHDANDTQDIIQRLSQIRAQIARLMGYRNFADYNLGDQMAKNADAATKLLTDSVLAATNKARGEAEEIQKLIEQQNGDFKVSAADWSYYAEQVRRTKYAMDSEQIKPYFELSNVLENGVFYAATSLYGITFKHRTDIPVYHPDVKVYEVLDKNGSPLALLYVDYFKRDSKSGGAWMDSFVEQNGLTGDKAVIFNVCNFTKPAPGQPALISFDDVVTMFHEFGHGLHGMLSNVKYPSIAGTNTPRDFVEFPSQFNEHWALDPKVFAHYAKHYQTKDPIPSELADKIRQTSTFNQGYLTTEYLAAALLDLAWHSITPDTQITTIEDFEANALRHFHIDLPMVPPRYRSSYFDHIWNGGYAASYYAYFWSEVLADDAYQWFTEHGGLTRDNGDTFRYEILSRGNSSDLNQLYHDFRGRSPNIKALLERRGL